ncbi:MAG: BMP family ABC transporter substrate-binding protein [Oscillospiraceae bacterium]|jgi:basic membrane protein A|nr:BMP family ABC transporter substrate-binding protein [Oscillospiraceae bacterium]
MKKVLAIAMIALLMLALIAACDNDSNGGGGSSAGVTKDNIKIGVVHIGPLADQGYTFNHDLGARTMISNLGLNMDQYIPKFDVGVDPANVTAAINELVQEGCHIIFATSFSHGFQMIEVAKEQPDIVFAHATGALAHTPDAPPNFHNYFAKIHQARYLAGIAAGLRTETNVLGYVAAHPFAEVISGYTAFYLGALSVNPDVTMEVIYINSWGDPPLEQQVATRLIELGADVIAQHSDSATPAIAAQELGAWHVGYNNDMREAAPDASMLSPRIDWSIYMTFAVKSVIDGTPIPADWGEGLSSGAAFITGLNDAIVAPGTDAAIDAARNNIINNNMMIFRGHLKDNDGNNAQITDYDGNVIFEFTDDNSFFAESTTTSAPSFNAIIAGINIIS